MLCCSAPFAALMRRNVLYRQRNFVATILDLALPIGFAAILLGIKAAFDSGSSSLERELIPAVVRTDSDTMRILSFSDYVTAILAQRVCVLTTVEERDGSMSEPVFTITGMPVDGYEWQVPFVWCDPRQCTTEGEDAYDFCEYPILAVAPLTANDAGGQNRSLEFQKYVNERFPQLMEPELTHFVGGDDYKFVRMFDSDAAINEYVASSTYGNTGSEKIGLAVVFEGNDTENYKYSIRANSTNFNSPVGASEPGAKTSPDTKTNFATYANEDTVCDIPGQGNPDQGYFQLSCTGLYIYNGFLTTQRLVQDWIMVDTDSKDAGFFVSEHGVNYVPFPSRAYEEDGAYADLAGFMPLLMTLGILYSCSSMVSYVVQEKELRQKELLKMMGVTDLEIGWSWFLSFWMFHIITATFVTLISASLFPASDFLLLFIFWQFCFLGFVVMSMMCSTFTAKTTRGVLIALLVVFAGFFFTLAADVETGSTGTISLLSLHPVTAMSYALLEVGRLENIGVGLTTDSMATTDAPSGYTFVSAYGNLVFSCIFMGIFTWYFNRTIAPDYGQALPFYFPFTTSYWFPSSVKHAEVKDNDGDGVDDNTPIEPVSDSLKQQTRDGQSIEIKSLKKDFGEKLAVDGLNLSMYNGHITALLGHNGAGKTTTIGMLTGALSPTSGTATIAGKDIRTEMSQIRDDIGICLQHDCLFPKLTVREHVQFFSRVKGIYGKMSHQEAEASVDQAIRDVALEEKSNTFSANLSGGMKRKLSVAMAFCGGSKVVFLDEPTSGMDPFSRRFSWNVIRQYRSDRCIILTTHFMDEADILGDRIAIMSEGRLRCCGSSLFLKKTYGVGYQLTIEKRSKFKSETTPTHQLPLAQPPIVEPMVITEDDEFDREIDVDDMDVFKKNESIDVGDMGDVKKNESIDVDEVDGKPIAVATIAAAAVQAVPVTEEAIKDIVVGAVEDAALLSNVGTELSFQLPLGASENFVPMLEQLDRLVQNGSISTYGVSITTLDEVFQIVARGEETDKHDFKSSHFSSKDIGAAGDEDEKSVRSRMDLENDGLFGTHVQALMRKRAANFKRDKKAWCCTTILPSMFVLIGLLVLKFAVPGRNMEPLLLDLNDYNKDSSADPRNPIPFNAPDSFFTCNPGNCTTRSSTVYESDVTGESYSFCGGETLANESCSISDSEEVVSHIDQAGAEGVGGDVESIWEASNFTLTQGISVQGASQYGGIFMNHDPSSITQSNESYGATLSQNCSNNLGDYVEESECDNYGTGIGYTVAYNFTALHAAPLFQALADEGIIRKALGRTTFKITTTIAPLPITELENTFEESANATNLWFLIVLSFPFILGAFATFVVAERESKAKHLQIVAGVTPASYWLATLLWDWINYLIPFGVTIVLLFAFDVSSLTTSEGNMFAGVFLLLLLFGTAGAAFSYCVSFMFKSPSLCNIALIVSGFLIAMGASMTCFILRLIGQQPYDYRSSLVTAAQVVEWIFRFFPPFCLGKGLLFGIYRQSFELINGKRHSAFDPEIMLIEIIFLAVESVVYLIAAIYIDILSSNPEFMGWVQQTLCCRRSSERSAVAAIPDDDDVIAEQQRVLGGQANEDAIVMSELTKIYPNGKIAVNQLSLGIAPGECFGLLGINGAGKTTTMGMLTAEFPPTQGDATLAGFSLRQEPEKTRRRIGYCPQFDAHFANLTGREHVELYASIKGIPSDSVRIAAAEKLKQVGLSETDSDRLSSNYSGGMKRRLSLACATIGSPQLVFLDECSTGVDPVARREIWQLVSDLVSAEVPEGGQKTSVILTTHSMDECEALCPRIGIMANGKLRCLGSAQHLKTKFGKGYQLELKVATTSKDDEDFRVHLVTLARSKGAAVDQEQASADDEVFFNLQEAETALQQVTGDDYLSSMLNEANPNGYGVFKDCSSATGVHLSDLTSFVTNEIRMRDLHSFIVGAYPSAILRERQDMKARFEVTSEGISIAKIFQSIEENKEQVKLSDYGVSQTSLEQVFNMHAAEAERLKQGRMDG
ncbi:Retinal-specific ATP-binding cassette transporter [Seminavis robusta]|uniref:Retinal-specific ATP-binding cassette transporter n=1 Tax=Seminavis robusta TaxID=568900 RepID=A0A9N8DX28_9STRA|nr:Retinal-specific ATP-binding cassette transporter [Seminavis robusta]|eukprot:Sro419_g138990.1 Retinal-specific ATP-binding cassette transporter (2013) ;mRNA; r:4745-12891